MSKYKNQLPEDLFIFGASYAPYAKAMDWPMEEWDKDMETMKKLNMNTIRVFAPWDRIEIEEGIFNYQKQDYLFELAAKHNLKVILNMGGLFGNLCGIYPPRYMIDNNRCQLSMKSPTHVPDISTPSVCPDDPLYREKAFQFMEKTVKRYSEYEELIVWMIWNEPSAPFCYCPHTLGRFHDYLRKKYNNDLDNLNAAWGTEYPVNFSNWDTIPAPVNPVALTMWHDWVRFNQYRLYDAMNKITEITEKYDPKKRPTTSNLVFHMAALEGPVSTPRYGLDIGRVGQSMSIMGLSSYIVEHYYDVAAAYSSAYKFSRLRSASQDENRRLLLLETGAGPNLHVLTDEQRRKHLWQLIAHNVKSIILWNYRSRLSDSQVALFNLMKWDGSVSRRAANMGEFSKILQDNAQLLNHVFPEKQAAILTLEEDQIRMEAICGKYSPSEYSVLHDSRIGAYKLLWDMQIPTDCIAENNLNEINQYKLLLLPMAEHMTEEIAEYIKDFVANGGTVIAESPFAFRNGEGHLQYSAPAFGLDEVFGCRTGDREGKETAFKINCPQGEAEVHFFWCEYELCGGEAIAQYSNGEAAVVRNRYGKGTAIVAGTEVFRQYIHNEQSAMTELLKREIMYSGVTPTAELYGANGDIEVSRLTGNDKVLYIIINHGDMEQIFNIKLRESVDKWTNIATGQSINLEGEIVLQPYEVLAIAN